VAGAIGIAAALRARFVKITCPHCGYVKQVERKPVAYRVCPRCKRQFPDPIAARKR
jgi:transposase-like protein